MGWCALLLTTGCTTICKNEPPCAATPRELQQVSLPPYVIESPDVVLIDALRLVPKPPYHISPQDALGIQVTNTLPNQPIAGVYSVDADGTVNLGFNYGTVNVDRLTIAKAKEAIKKYLLTEAPPAGRLKEPIDVTVLLAEGRAIQQVRGPHLVRLDGTVGLGVYGSVSVDGLTIEQAKTAIEVHLTQYFVAPEVSVDVAGFNSKVYYVVTDGGGAGEQVVRVPMTGKTTVLDALSQVNGLSPVSDKHLITLVRPAPCGSTEDTVMHVQWNAIVRKGRTETNYQVIPGDRIYVNAQPLVTTDTVLARVISPMERIFGIALLGHTTVQQLNTRLDVGNHANNANNNINVVR
jgi:polysaccharide export outer membrane protein